MFESVITAIKNIDSGLSLSIWIPPFSCRSRDDCRGLPWLNCTLRQQCTFLLVNWPKNTLWLKWTCTQFTLIVFPDLCYRIAVLVVERSYWILLSWPLLWKKRLERRSVWVREGECFSCWWVGWCGLFSGWLFTGWAGRWVWTVVLVTPQQSPHYLVKYITRPSWCQRTIAMHAGICSRFPGVPRANSWRNHSSSIGFQCRSSITFHVDVPTCQNRSCFRWCNQMVRVFHLYHVCLCR